MTGELERALAQTERDAIATLRAAETALKSAKRALAAAKTGDLAALDKAMRETDEATITLSIQSRNTTDGWVFDSKAYAEAGGLASEIRSAAESEGLTIYEQDGRLFCYPVLLRVRSSDPPVVEIDRKALKTVRPSFIARELKKLRERRQRFTAPQFLETLFDAYDHARRALPGAPRTFAGRGPVLELATLFDLLTLFPDTKKDYGRAEFTRDLYLLDSSRIVETKGGYQLDLSASTGTKGSASKLFQIVAQNGSSKVYYGISFR